jgi:polysaccharide pyruvyl transferase WcaK-like protein
MQKPPPSPLVFLADVGGPAFHIGDEAMLAANLAALRRVEPERPVTVIGREARDAQDGDIAKILATAGGLFLSGGGNLSSSWPDLLHQRLLWLREAKRLGVPAVTGGQTIGPDLAPGEHAALAGALAGVEHLGVRELPSAALALAMGVPAERLAYQPDDAFFLAGRAPAAAEARELPDEPYLALTLDPTFAAASSRAGLAGLAAQLARFAAESGLRLAFLPHVGSLGSHADEGRDEGREVDLRAGSALARLLAAQGTACALLPVMPPEAAVWITQRAALIVSSRYHPLVFATAAAVPCLGLYRDAYTRIKLQGALLHAGMEAWCLSQSAAEEGGLLAALRRLWAGRDGARETMRQALPALAAVEETRWRRLWARLGRRPEPADRPDAGPLGWPAERITAQALHLLHLERQASDDETWRWRSIVKNLERPLDLADRTPPGARREGRRKTLEATPMSTERLTQPQLTDQQWIDYDRDGFLHLGRVLEPAEVDALRRRADDLALGNLRNPEVQMQLDTGGAYEELPAARTAFDQGTLLYRKIQGLETDDLYSRLVKHPLMLEICGRQYGRHAAISIFRAMVMNKPAGQGTDLPWHQDGGHVWALDRDPLVTVWVALDPATRANGCVEVIPGSHRLGLLSLYGSTVADEDVARHCPPERVHPLEVESGHAVVLHNWLIHRSGVNPTSAPRRAFTVCYMDGRTQSILTGRHFPLVAGELSAEPYPFVRHLQDENRTLREMRDDAERYAKSLEAARERNRGLLPFLKTWLRGS